MRFQRKRFQLALIVLGALLPIAIGLRLYTYWGELDLPTGLFAGQTTCCTIFNVLGFLVLAGCLILSLSKGGQNTERKTEAMTPDEAQLLVQNQTFQEEEEDFPEFFLQGFARKTAVWTGTLSSFASFLPGFGFLAYALSFFADGALSATDGDWVGGITSVLKDPYHLVFALLSLISGLYFILYALKNSAEKSKVRPFFALVPALWCTVRMVVEYRDLARFVNKELYVGQFLFIISALVFFLYQAQLLFGEKPLSRPNSYAFCALPPAFFGLTARFTHLIAAMGDRIAVDLVDASTLIIDLAITLYILVKIQSVLRRGDEK